MSLALLKVARRQGDAMSAAKGPWTAPALLWLVAFGLRCLYIHQSASSPFFAFPLVDAQTYTEAATRMAVEGQWDGGAQPFWQPPLYPYFLGLLFAWFRPDYYLPRLVQAALGATSCVLVLALGRRIFSARIGLAAGFLCAACGPLLYYEAELLPPALAIFLNLLSLLALLWARTGGPLRLLAAGLLLGLAALCVANALFFLPVAAGWLYWQNRALPGRRRLLQLLLLGAGTALAIAPVTLRNLLVGGDWVLISTNAGINFFIGNNPNYEATVQIQPGPQWLALVSRPRLEAGLSRPAEQSDFFFAQAWSFIREHPLDYLWLLLHKTWLFWHGAEVGRNQDLYHARHYSVLLGALLWKAGIAFPFGLLSPLALLGMGLAWRQGLHRRPGFALLLLFTFSYALSVVLFFVTTRYRLPVVPVLCLFSVYGLGALFTLFRQRQHRALVGTGTSLALLSVLTNFRVGPMDMEGSAETHHRLGFAYQQQGLSANAMAAYQKALELDPQIQEARFNLGSLYAAQGRYDRAIATYREFIARFPAHPEARYALGNALLMSRKYPEAIAEYGQVLTAGSSITPASLWGRLAYAHLQLGQPDQAERAYGELLKARPDSLLARLQLGQLYESRQRYPAAREEYQELLRRDSTHAEARYRLAYVLLQEKRPEDAKTHLEQLLAQRPGEVQARWLLASQYVVEHRGPEALAQAEAILRLDPTHVPANWLAGHLRVIKGDTLGGVVRLEQFKKLYVEKRSEQIGEVLRQQLREEYGQLLRP